jgi:diacylglycerol kinase (ATP)
MLPVTGSCLVKVAVVAHRGKSFGGGLTELRRLLAEAGVDDLRWYEVDKSRHAPPSVRKARKHGAELLFVWGGDGMVQRCVNELVGHPVTMAVLPAGTANLFATNLGIPSDLEEAVAVGLHGQRRTIDVGVLNGEAFAVMAGVGFDAAMIRAAGSGLKDRFGRAAYIWTGSRELRAKPFNARVKTDGVTWYDGEASCILLGNVSRLFGGLEVFEDVQLDDNQLDVGIVTASGMVAWLRVLGRTVVGSAASSPLAQTTKAHRVKIQLDRKVRYELDGGDRTKVRTIKAKAKGQAITICVPASVPSH